MFDALRNERVKQQARAVYSLEAPACYAIATGNMMASSAPNPQDHADRRVYPRVPVAMPAFLHADGERHSVRLLDLSAGGAKLDCPINLSVGTTVMLDCGTLGRAAVVRWRNGGQIGVCFDSELDVREISALFARSTALAARMKTPE